MAAVAITPWAEQAAQVVQAPPEARARFAEDWRGALLGELGTAEAGGPVAWGRLVGRRAKLPTDCVPAPVQDPAKLTLSAEALRAAGDGETRREAKALRRRIGSGLDQTLGQIMADGLAARCGVARALGRPGDRWRSEAWAATQVVFGADPPTDPESAARWRKARTTLGEGFAEADLATLAEVGLWWTGRVHEAASMLLALPKGSWPEEPIIVATSLGPLWIGNSGTNSGTGAPWLLVDPGGDDAWSFTSIDADGLPDEPVRAVIDLGGDDTWRSADLGPGAAIFGVTGGVDWEGNDLYDGGALSFAAAAWGVATWVDRGGDDVWNGGKGNFGWAMHGAAMLRDDAGEDRYAADVPGLGAAGPHGLGVVIDGDGRAAVQALGGRGSLGGPRALVSADERDHGGGLAIQISEHGLTLAARDASGTALWPAESPREDRATVPSRGRLQHALWALAEGGSAGDDLAVAMLLEGRAQAGRLLAAHAARDDLGSDERRAVLAALVSVEPEDGDGDPIVAALALWDRFRRDSDAGTRRAVWRLLEGLCHRGAAFDRAGHVHIEQAGATALVEEFDDETWAAVAGTLGLVGDPSVVPGLGHWIRREDPRRAALALEALSRILARGEVAAVIRVLYPLAEEPGRLPTTLLGPVLALLARTHHREIPDLITIRLDDSDPEVRILFLELARAHGDREIVGVLRKAAKLEQDPRVQAAFSSVITELR